MGLEVFQFSLASGLGSCIEVFEEGGKDVKWKCLELCPLLALDDR